MFAGKTTEMIRRITRHRISGKRVVIMKWKKDLREGEVDNVLMTHDHVEFPCVRVRSLIHNCPEDVDVIGIDDGHFFEKDLITFCKMAVYLGKIVIVSALDSDYRMQPFIQVCLLLAIANKVKKLSAICLVCSMKAHFTKRVNAVQGAGDLRIQVGGSENYKAVCRLCHDRKSQWEHEVSGEVD